MEKRTSIRHKRSTSIVWSYLTSDRSAETYEGKIKNCCTCGLYAELQVPVREGTTLVVRAAGGPGAGPSEPGFRWLTLAQVKWSKPRSVDGMIRYGTGLKYVML